MSLFPRLSPNGLRIVTQDVRRYGPCWLSNFHFASYIGNGPSITTSDGKVYPWPEPDMLTAGGGIFAAAYWGQNGVKGIRLSSGFTVVDGFHPALSEDGRLVYLMGHDSQQQTVRDFGGTTYDSGAPLEYPRACTGGLCWSRYTGMTAHHRETWFAPWAGAKQRVHASGDLIEFRPVPVDTPTGVWIATFTHTEVRLYPVGSTEGYIFQSVDARALDAKWNGSGIRLVWNGPDGRLFDQVVDLAKPRVQLNVPIVPPPPPPPAPPQIPKVTISSYLPTSGPAPLRVRAVAVITEGKANAKSFLWSWRKIGGVWSKPVSGNGLNPVTDTDHHFTFTVAGEFEIRVQITDLTGKITDTTRTPRKVTVTAHRAIAGRSRRDKGGAFGE